MTNIEYFLPQYPQEDDSNFYQDIYNKKEFDILSQLDTTDISKPGIILPQQKNLSRYISQYTPYNSLLIFHKPGTGKTCTAINIVEGIKPSGLFNGAVILAKGQGLLDNILNELVFVCTTGKYVPEGYEYLTENQKIRRLFSSVSDFYTFSTFATFAKELQNLTDAQIKENYSNKIFILDEVHNIRILSENDLRLVYSQLFRLFHTAENLKIIFLTGTPMKDSPEEIASLMNLLLPLDRQLPLGSDFINEYLIKDPDGTFRIKPEKQTKLKSYFKGKVSYLRELQSQINTEYIGAYLGGLKYIKVYPDIMSPFQTEAYLSAYNNDTGGGRTESFYSGSRQASLFVFPDGSYGSKGFKRYIEKKKVMMLENKGKEYIDYRLKPELVDAIIGANTEQSLQKLEIFSSKYASAIRNILLAENKNCFVYFEFVEGSGAILFSKILELFGFTRSKGKDKRKKLRYAIITNRTTGPAEVRRVMNIFNSPDNLYGDYIKVIIGSGVLKEGFTLKNIQEIFIMTPFWNYAEIEQAKARGIRMFSHDDLINQGVDVTVNIYQYVSIPKGQENKSIDLEMYVVSERKDVSIKRMERLMKEACFDCGFNYSRNVLPWDKDYSRECDYMKCLYPCDGLYNINDRNDYSTYQLYYNDGAKQELLYEIKSLFRLYFSRDYKEIISMFPAYTEFEINQVLYDMVYKNIIIHNKYGFTSFLRENNNIYFLSDINDPLTSYYNKYPTITKPKMNLKSLVEKLYLEEFDVCSFINNIDTAKLNTLPQNLQKLFIQIAIIYKVRKGDDNKNINTLFDFYKNYIINRKSTWVITLLIPYTCLEESKILEGDYTWHECNPGLLSSVEKQVEDDDKKFLNTEFGYYGIKDINTGKFYIRDVTDKQNINIRDMRKILTGKVCTSWKVEELIPIILKMKLPYSDCTLKPKDNELLEKLKLSHLKNEDKCRVVYWITSGKKSLCKKMEDWFRENNLLQTKAVTKKKL